MIDSSYLQIYSSDCNVPLSQHRDPFSWSWPLLRCLYSFLRHILVSQKQDIRITVLIKHPHSLSWAFKKENNLSLIQNFNMFKLTSLKYHRVKLSPMLKNDLDYLWVRKVPFVQFFKTWINQQRRISTEFWWCLFFIPYFKKIILFQIHDGNIS